MKNLILTFFVLFFSLNSYASNRCGLNLKTTKELSNYHYVLIPGFLNEIMSYYLTEHRRFLLLNGVPAEQIHRLNISSLNPPQDSVSLIENLVDSLSKDKKIVFISHSKGALETLYFLNEKLNVSFLEKAVLVQGALDGSSVTRLSGSEGFPGFVDDVWTYIKKIVFVDGFNKSFESETVRKNLMGLENNSELLNKLIFVETETEYEDLHWKFKFLGGLYKDFLGTAGDGVLLKADQIPHVLKDRKDLCRFDYVADHSDFVKAAPWESARVLKIRNFLKRILFRLKRDQ